MNNELIAIRNLEGQMIAVRVYVIDFETLRFSTCGRVTIHTHDPNGPPYVSVGHLQCDPNTLLKLDPVGREDDYLIEILSSNSEPRTTCGIGMNRET